MAAPGFWRLFPNVRDEERPRFGFFGLVAFLFTLAQTVGLAGSEALFLTKLGASRLPVAMLVSALAASSASALYAWQVGRRRNDQLFVWMLGAGAAILLAMMPFISFDASRYGLLAGFFVLQAVGLIHLRTFATDYFDTLASKRIFPLLAVVGSCGGFIGGCLASILPRVMDSRWLILIWAFGLVLTAAWILSRRHRLRRWKPDDEEDDAPEFRQLRSAILWLRRGGLPRSLAFTVAAMVIAMSLLHYISSALFVESFSTAESLAAFLGLYLAASNVIEIVIARWLTPWLLQRVGVPGAQLVHPVLTAVSFMVVGVAPGLTTAVLARADRELLENAFAGEVRNLAYNALPMRLRGSVRALVEGGIFYASFALGGLTLLLIGQGVSIEWLAATGLVFVALYGLGARRVSLAYLARLREDLRDGHLRVVDLEQSLGKPELDELASEWASIVSNPADASGTNAMVELSFVLARAGYHQVIGQGIRHPDPTLRIACLEALAESDAPDMIAALVTSLDDEDVRVRERAAVVLRRYAGTLSKELIECAHLHTSDPSPAVRAEVALALGPDGEDLLLEQARSENPHEAVEALSRLSAHHLDLARVRATDPDPQIQAAALSRLAEIATPEMLTRIDVTAVLTSPDARLRCSAVKVLTRQTRPDVANFLGRLLGDPDAGVRSAAKTGLISLRAGGIKAAESTARLAPPPTSLAAFDVLAALEPFGGKECLRQQLRTRVERAWRVQLAIATRTRTGSFGRRFLHLALGNRAAQDVRAAFEILARLESELTMRHVELGLQHPSDRRRSDVLELLGHLADRQASTALALLLEAGSLLEKRAQLGTWLRLDHGDEAIRTIGSECGDRWLTLACKLEAGAEPAPQEIEIMEKLLALRRVPLFTHLSLDELSAISEQARVVSYLAGEIVVREGEGGDELYTLLEGEVDAVAQFGSEEERVVNHLSAPDCFGELSILDDSPRSATIIVRKDARLLALDGNLLRDILREVPKMAIDLLRAMSGKVRAADERTTELLRNQATRLGE